MRNVASPVCPPPWFEAPLRFAPHHEGFGEFNARNHPKPSP